MQTNDYSKIIFSGQRRVFFLILGLALLMQAALFLHNRMYLALDLISSDFKIAVTLNNASSAEAEIFRKTLLNIEGVRDVKIIDPQKTMDSFKKSNSSFAALVQAINPDFLPHFYDVKVSTEVMLNPKIWVYNNIGSMEQDASAYYKEDHARMAVYVNSLIRFGNILMVSAVFAFFAFGFFVEAYYTRISTLRERLGGVIAGAFACGLVFILTYILVSPVNKIYPAFSYNMFCWQELAVLIICIILGWSMAKWKKF